MTIAQVNGKKATKNKNKEAKTAIEVECQKIINVCTLRGNGVDNGAKIRFDLSVSLE